MFSMELWIDGKVAGRIDDVKVGSMIAFRVVEPPPKPDPAVLPCPCGSGAALANCHGAEPADAGAPEAGAP